MHMLDDKKAAVERMKDYIESHLRERITLTGLSHCSKYSPWYAARLFKEQTGKNPFEYIRLRRLSSAARNLNTFQDKIVEVAFDFVFDSHEGFTRAFARYFGMSPREFRKKRPPVVMFLPEQMRDYYKTTEKEGERSMAKSTENQTIFVQVLERPARKLILKRGIKATHYFEYCDEVGCEVWETLGKIKNTLHEPMGLWLPEQMVVPGTSTYAQGVEVPFDYDEPVPEGFDMIELRPCMIMVFQGQPFDDDNFENAIHSLWEEMKNYNPENYGFAWDDDAAPRFQLEPAGYRGYIEGRPVKRLENLDKPTL